MTHRIERARRNVAEARSQLIETARELQQRLAPKTLARDAWESAKVKGADLAEDAVEAVKKRPLAVGGALAALTMFLAREPLKDGVSNFYEAMNKRKKPVAKSSGRAAKPSDTAGRNRAKAPAVQNEKKPARPARTRKATPKTVEKAS